MQWSEAVSGGGGEVTSPGGTKTVDVSTMMLDGDAPAEIKEAWQECEQLRKAVLKNNGMKRNIAKVPLSSPPHRPYLRP